MNEWINELAKDETYAGIDVQREYGKMVNWCKVNNKLPTRRRFVNWLNRTEKPLKIASAPATSYTSVKRKTRDPSEEEFKLAGEIARSELERFRKNLYQPKI